MKLHDQLHDSMNGLTASERKVALALLADYPFAGLLTVAELSTRANVSTQTVLRLASKLGFDGYSEFQNAFTREIKRGYGSPLMLRAARGAGGQGEGFFASLAESTLNLIRETTALVTEKQLDEVSRLIGDPRRSVFLLGGRITQTLALYFYRHLRQIRSKTHMVPSANEEWPDAMMRMTRNDVVIMFDFRRYQKDLVNFADMAAASKAKIVLITDKWLSPVSRRSAHILTCPVDAGTPWDTAVPAILVIEALINKISELDWDKTSKRLEKWDALRKEEVDRQPRPIAKRNTEQ